MNRLTTVAMTGILGAALLATGPAFAQTAPGTGTSPAKSTKVKADLTCGKITEITDDHITVKPDVGEAKVIKIGARTDFVARSLLAARHGLHEGDYARTRGGDGADGNARAVEWAEADLCREGQIDTYVGTVTSFNGTTLTFTDQHNNAVSVNIEPGTKFYVHGVLQHTPPTINPGTTVHVLARENGDGSQNALRVALP